jgi:hypothetical protein
VHRYWFITLAPAESRFMAIYHCRFKVHSRGGGAKAASAAAYRSGTRVVGRSTSAVRAAAYRAGGILTDVAGEVHDFTKKQGVVWNSILAPDNAPSWVYERNRLWNTVEQAEKRKDAQLFREAELSIPRELNPTERIALVRSFVQDQFVKNGMIADTGIHCPKASDGGEQPHAHVMLTMRDIGPEGFGNKRRDWNDIGAARKEAGEKSQLMQWREAWQTYCNAALEEAGSAARVDHRTLGAQGKDHERQPHQGPAVHVRELSDGYARKKDDLIRVKFQNRARATVRAVAYLQARQADLPKGNPGARKADLPKDSPLDLSDFDRQRQATRQAVGRMAGSDSARRVMDGMAHAARVARQLRIVTPEHEKPDRGGFGYER